MYVTVNYTVCGERVVLLLLLNCRERQYILLTGKRRPCLGVGDVQVGAGDDELADDVCVTELCREVHGRTAVLVASVHLASCHTHTHTHTQTRLTAFFSGTARVGRYQKGKTNLDFTEARDSEWQWHQLGSMQVCTLLQTDNHASTPPLSFLQAGCPSCRPTNSVKALKAKHTHRQTLHKKHVAIRHANTPVQASTDREHGP